jgi:hypothetical protein
MATRRRSRSLEEAEIRKVEAETAEIEARTALRWSAILVFWLVPVISLVLGAVDSGFSGDLLREIGRWLPTFLFRP